MSHFSFQLSDILLFDCFSHTKYIGSPISLFSFPDILLLHSLVLCSLSNNNISADGVCALVGALLVNQSLQKLKLE